MLQTFKMESLSLTFCSETSQIWKTSYFTLYFASYLWKTAGEAPDMRTGLGFWNEWKDTGSPLWQFQINWGNQYSIGRYWADNSSQPWGHSRLSWQWKFTTTNWCFSFFFSFGLRYKPNCSIALLLSKHYEWATLFILTSSVIAMNMGCWFIFNATVYLP